MGHGTETEGGVGRGTGDGTKWEGEAPAEPKRQRIASGERRVTTANGKTAANWVAR
jgi:hypothetical protein